MKKNKHTQTPLILCRPQQNGGRMSPILPPPPTTHHQIELFFTLQELKKISISVFLNEKKRAKPKPTKETMERKNERERERVK